METVRNDRVFKLFPTARLTTTEHDVVLHVLEHLDKNQEVSIREIASSCFTSMTTVTRASKKLGYSGFREMVYALKTRTADQDQSIISSNELRASLTYDAEHLARFYDLLDRKELIGLKGEGYSHLISEYMQHKLLGRGYPAVEQDYLYSDQFATMMHDHLSLMIIVSKSGRTPAAVHAAQECVARGIPVAAFVGNTNNPIVDLADMLFLVEDDQPLDNSNSRPGSFTGCCILAFERILYKYEEELGGLSWSHSQSAGDEVTAH